MKSNTKVILHFGNDELILEDDKISDFNSGLSSVYSTRVAPLARVF